MATSLVDPSSVPDEPGRNDLSPYSDPPVSRMPVIDALKGVAVLGGLFFAIYTWGGISKGMQGSVLQKFNATHAGQVLVSFLVEDKMRTLLLMAFGASTLLLLVRPHANSRFHSQEMLIRRNFFLLLLGIFNGVLLLWPNDILYGIGITGVLFFAFTRMGARGLFIATMVTMAIGCGKVYWHYYDDRSAYRKFLVVETKEKKIKADSLKLKDSLKTGFKKTDTLTWKQQEEKSAWEGISKKYKWEKKDDSGQIKALQDGRYWKVYDHQLKATQNRESWWFFQFGFWYFASALLLGMALFKHGFFHGRYSAIQYLIVSLITLTGGFFLFRYRMHGWLDAMKDYTIFVKKNPLPGDQFKPIEMIFVAFSYASLAMFFVKKGWLDRLTQLMAKVGRMAMTLYILQSIMLAILFYGFGMGYYARIPQNWLYLVVLELILIQLVFAVVWLRYFHLGPVEWLVQSLAKGMKQPFRK